MWPSRLRINRWQREERLQLELVGLRPSGARSVVANGATHLLVAPTSGVIRIRNEGRGRNCAPASFKRSQQSKTTPIAGTVSTRRLLALGLGSLNAQSAPRR